ncbi:Alpha-crystallin A chain [Folsomia candida]|uniref:Alpha-crystallin A chain n=1 Tax=Folsomia candida TaxID=158441 RepID=A0A226CWK2_FOLCA|nr:Alpha-crystallin A chain [Folsomia candida]
MECPGVKISKEQVAISLEIPNFLPDEVQVKTVGDELIILGSRHDDGEDVVQGLGGTGSCGKIGVKANFTRKYPLPLNSKKDAIYCEFSQNIGKDSPTLRVIVPRVPSVVGDEEIEHVINIV